MSGKRLFISLALVPLFAIGVELALAQSGKQEGVKRVSFTADKAEPTRTITFGRPTPAVGDQVEQTLTVKMRLATSLRRGNNVGEKATTTMRNEQYRTFTTTDVMNGRSTGVLVRYDRATTLSHKVVENAPPPSDAAQAAAPVPQAVEGKSYHCHREPGEGGRLVITDADGNIPPMKEYEIVARNMESVGQANPFVEFLSGRSVQVGETISLPKEVAERLFGVGDQFGEVLRFDLTLQRSEVENRSSCAKFLARVDAASSGSSQMRLQVEGPLDVDIDSCRAVRIELNGPIGMSETRGSYSTAQQLIGMGKLAVTIESKYLDAGR